MSAAVLEPAGLETLVAALRARGFTVVGPVERSRAIVFDEIESAAELATGVEDVQDGGTYRLRSRDDGALFAHTVGPRLGQALPVPARRSPSGARTGTRKARWRSSRRPRRRGTRSSASGPATCTPSRSRTASSSTASAPTTTTRRAAATPSSSRSTARGRVARASARRWGRGRGWKTDTTSR